MRILNTRGLPGSHIGHLGDLATDPTSGKLYLKGKDEWLFRGQGVDRLFFPGEGGGLSGYDGVDPVLGDPYPPVWYQLFVEEASQPRLHWSVPTVGGSGAIKFYNASLSSVYVRFKNINNATGVSPTLVLAGTSTNLSVPANTQYVWVTAGPAAPSFPANPNLGTGSASGSAVPQSPFPPQYINWNGTAVSFTGYWVQVNSISGYSLYRSTNGIFTGTVTAGQSVYTPYNPQSDVLIASPAAGDTSYSGDTTTPNHVYGYRLVGHTDSFDFIYNDVTLIQKYALTIVQQADGLHLSWDG